MNKVILATLFALLLIFFAEQMQQPRPGNVRPQPEDWKCLSFSDPDFTKSCTYAGVDEDMCTIWIRKQGGVQIAIRTAPMLGAKGYSGVMVYQTINIVKGPEGWSRQYITKEVPMGMRGQSTQEVEKTDGQDYFEAVCGHAVPPLDDEIKKEFHGFYGLGEADPPMKKPAVSPPGNSGSFV